MTKREKEILEHWILQIRKNYQEYCDGLNPDMKLQEFAELPYLYSEFARILIASGHALDKQAKALIETGAMLQQTRGMAK